MTRIDGAVKPATRERVRREWRSGNGLRRVERPGGTAVPDRECEMIGLHRAIECLLPEHPARAVQFIGLGAREAASTLARDLATVSSIRMGRCVAFLDLIGGLSGRRMSSGPSGPSGMIDALKACCDLVLVATPPLRPSGEGSRIPDGIDGVILVHSGGEAGWGAVVSVRERIAAQGGTILGMVFEGSADRRYCLPGLVYRHFPPEPPSR